MSDWQNRFDEALAAAMAHRIGGAEPVRVLEAGGGSQSYVKLDHPLHVTTIDISPEQIERNTTSDVAIVGDLATHDFGESKFDVVMCWNVLEHVADAANAIRHLAETLDAGGVLVVRGPDPRSMKGLVTALTPHRVHVMFHRYVLDRPNAGQPGFAPFPTHMEIDAGPDALRDAFPAAGLEVVHEERFINDHVLSLKQKYYPLYAGYRLVSKGLRIVTLGRYGAKQSDFVIVAQRPHAADRVGADMRAGEQPASEALPAKKSTTRGGRTKAAKAKASAEPGGKAPAGRNGKAAKTGGNSAARAKGNSKSKAKTGSAVAAKGKPAAKSGSKASANLAAKSANGKPKRPNGADTSSASPT